MSPILEMARARGLWVVEDAACGFGAWYHGRHAGTLGDAGCFSFHPRKSITTGEGGMVTTAQGDLADMLRSLRDHGATRSDLSRHEAAAGFLLAEYPRLGFNFRMTDIQGALGGAQMDRASYVLASRARVAAAYERGLAGAGWLNRPSTPDGCVHGYQAYVCLFAPEPPTVRNVERLHRLRNELMTKLEDAGVATRQGTHAAALAQYYARKYGIEPARFPHAWMADRLSLALPLYPQMTDEEQAYVCEQVVDVGSDLLRQH
jgi:dTDP-4-amino-4,6-dideoxygalactose transaminase